MTIINSRQNPRVKEAARLRDARHRKRQQRILIDGVRELSRAMAAGVRMIEVFVCEELCQGPDAQRLLAALGGCGGEILPVSRPVFEKLAFGDRAEGVLGVAEMPRRIARHLALPENPLVAVLEGVEKPGNVGAVLRSADGAGVSALIVADAAPICIIPTPSAPAWARSSPSRSCEAPAAETLAWLRQRGLRIFAARLDGSVAYTAADYRGPAALVLGSEAAGLSPLWSAADVTAVRLPMLGAADSLNVSAAAAVLFYEARRQRGE